MKEFIETSRNWERTIHKIKTKNAKNIIDELLRSPVILVILKSDSMTSKTANVYVMPIIVKVIK